MVSAESSEACGRGLAGAMDGADDGMDQARNPIGRQSN